MLSRRNFLRASLMGVSSIALLPTSLCAQVSLSVIGFEKGDPSASEDPVVYDPEIVSQLLSPISAKSFSTIDPIPDFPAQLLSVAREFDGMDRWKNPDAITKMLNLFGCPFKDSKGNYVAFCAAGLGYCSALAFARSANLPTDNVTLRRILPTVDFFNYYPSPGVLNMSQVARGKSRWIPAHSDATPTPGSLVIYDWNESVNPKSVSHTGILVSIDGDRLNTFEFNTTSKEHPTGGVIRPNTRDYNKTVKGFVITTTRKITQLE